MSGKLMLFNCLWIFGFLLVSSTQAMVAQEKGNYNWVDDLLTNSRVIEAKSKLDSIMVLHPSEVGPVFHFKRAHVYYDLFMQSTTLIGVQKNEWLYESLRSFNKAIQAIYKTQRISDSQLDRLQLNAELVLKYSRKDPSPSEYRDEIRLLLEAERSNELWSEISLKPVDQTELYRKLTSVYLKDGKTADAIAYLEDILADSANVQFKDISLLARLHRQQTHYDEAFALYKRAYCFDGKVSAAQLKALLNDWVEMSLINEQDSILVNHLVDTCHRLGAYEYFVIAGLYENQANLDSAERFYLLAINADSTLLDASYNLGIIYYNKASTINKQLSSGFPEADVGMLVEQRQMLYEKALPLFVRARALNAESIDKIVQYLQKVTNLKE